MPNQKPAEIFRMDLTSLWPVQIMKIRVSCSQEWNKEISKIVLHYSRTNENPNGHGFEKWSSRNILLNYKSPEIDSLLSIICASVIQYLQEAYSVDASLYPEPSLYMWGETESDHSLLNRPPSKEGRIYCVYFSEVDTAGEGDPNTNRLIIDRQGLDLSDYLAGSSRSCWSNVADPGILYIIPGDCLSKLLPCLSSRSVRRVLITSVEFSRMIEEDPHRKLSMISDYRREME